jgi:hypothetical protein
MPNIGLGSGLARNRNEGDERRRIVSTTNLARNAAEWKERQLTDGNFNSKSPAWDVNSVAFVFGSDCGRRIGLAVLSQTEIGPSRLP